ncbi:hypothetical protein ACFVGO_39330, partial [Kitasatospora sp. NPDC057738]
MTTPFPEPATPAGPSSPAAPPPGCPAHAGGGIAPTGPGGLRRLYGPEAETDPAGLYEKLRVEVRRGSG